MKTIQRCCQSSSTINRNKEINKWMTDLIKKKSGQKMYLNKILLPGSHDSATHEINWYPITNATKGYPNQTIGIVRYFLKFWTETQVLTMYEQLAMGIRNLDIRLVYHSTKNGYEKNCWYLHHTYTCYPLKKGLEQIIKFMDDTEGSYESIILTFMSNNYDDSICEELKILEPYISETFDMEVMKERNKRIIALWYSNFPIPNPKYLGSDRFINSWISTSNFDAKYRYLVNQLQVHKDKDKDVIHNLTFFVTSQVKDIVFAIVAHLVFPCQCTGTKTLSDKMNKKYFDKLLDNPDLHNANIILLDYVDKWRVQKIIDLNYQIH